MSPVVLSFITKNGSNSINYKVRLTKLQLNLGQFMFGVVLSWIVLVIHSIHQIPLSYGIRLVGFG